MSQENFCRFCRLISLPKVAAMSKSAGNTDPHFAFRQNQNRAATYWPLITMIEIAMRNKFASEIQGRINQDFFTDPMAISDSRIAKRISRAKLHRGNLSSSTTRDGVISSLPIGFWGLLMNKKYESTFWTPALRHAFAGLGKTSRAEVHEALQTAIVLRNRIAHHENILRYDPERTVEILDWLLELLEPGSSQFAKLNQDMPLHPVE
jgi:hypothetical protein